MDEACPAPGVRSFAPGFLDLGEAGCGSRNQLLFEGLRCSRAGLPVMLRRMSQDALWMGRYRHRQSRALCSVRVRDATVLPHAQSEVELIDDPFCDPQGDGVSQARSCPAKETLSLAEFERSYAPELPLRPGKVIGIGRNFVDHAKELHHEVPTEPLLFFKPSTALLLDGASLRLPREVGRIDMEAELVLVIGRPGRHIKAAQAQDHVGALVMGNDLSARELQKSQPRWVRAKGADGFAPLGQWLRVCNALPPQDLRVRGWLDDELVQDAPISDFVFDIPTLLANISKTMTLETGDLIFTGTPAGVRPLSAGQQSRVQAQGMCLAGVCTRFE